MRAHSELDIHNVVANIEQARRASDKWIGIGPFGIGLDGVLAFVPVVGQFYTAGAAVYMLAQGVKARASGITLLQSGSLFLVDLAIGMVPVAGSIPDALLCSSLWAGWLLKRDISRTIYTADKNDPRIGEAMNCGRRVVLLPAA